MSNKDTTHHDEDALLPANSSILPAKRLPSDVAVQGNRLPIKRQSGEIARIGPMDVALRDQKTVLPPHDEKKSTGWHKWLKPLAVAAGVLGGAYALSQMDDFMSADKPTYVYDQLDITYNMNRNELVDGVGHLISTDRQDTLSFVIVNNNQAAMARDGHIDNRILSSVQEFKFSNYTHNGAYHPKQASVMVSKNNEALRMIENTVHSTDENSALARFVSSWFSDGEITYRDDQDKTILLAPKEQQNKILANFTSNGVTLYTIEEDTHRVTTMENALKNGQKHGYTLPKL